MTGESKPFSDAMSHVYAGMLDTWVRYIQAALDSRDDLTSEERANVQEHIDAARDDARRLRGEQ